MKIEAASYGWGRLTVSAVLIQRRRSSSTTGMIRTRPATGISVSAIYQDRSGTLWFGTWMGTLSRFDDKTNTFVN